MIDLNVAREGLQRQLKTLEDNIRRHLDEQSSVNQPIMDGKVSRKLRAAPRSPSASGATARSLRPPWPGCSRASSCASLKTNLLIEKAWIAGPLASRQET